MLVLCVCGCSFNSGRVRLLNYDLATTFFGDIPDQIRVVKGDTLYSISKRYNVPLRDLITANNLRPPYTLSVGQVLRIPSAKYHIVAKGDTLYSISRRYNVDMPTLSRTNNLTAPWTLHIGQKLLLPGSIVTGKGTSTARTSSTKYSTKKTTAQKSSSRAKYTYVQPSTKRKSNFIWPVKGTVISKFGPVAKGRNNDGINIKAARGTAVRAADAGTVAYAGNELKGFGNLILIRHSDGYITAYAHNDRLLVKKGQKVARGEKIAVVGSTGGVNSPQLHFELRAGTKAVNPLNYLP